MNYIPWKVTLSDNQKISLATALRDKEAVTIRLSHSALLGFDELMLTKTQMKRIDKAYRHGKGVDLKISKTQISKLIQRGGSLYSSLAALVPKLAPKLLSAATKVATKALPALATGAVTSLGNFTMDKILGQGLQGGLQRGGFLIPQDKINKLMAYTGYLTKKQKEELMAALQSGSQFFIKPTPKQSGGFLGTLLASIGIPMVLNALMGKGLQNRKPGEGGGLQNRPYNQYGEFYFPPPFIGRGSTKGKKTGFYKGEGLLLGKNSPFNGIPILGALL